LSTFIKPDVVAALGNSWQLFSSAVKMQKIISYFEK
jgi:hypothetical protein